VTLEVLAFWVVALALVGTSLGVVLTPNLFHAVLFLAGALVATAAVFLLLDAAFLMGVQLLLYAGGVVTIVVFAIMLTERLVGERISQTTRYLANGAVVAAALLVGVVGVLVQAATPVERPALGTDVTTGIGRALVGPHAVTLELLGVLLVAALLGAVYLARTDD
jgi:NADH-quinone oxidoreductase subunit J